MNHALVIGAGISGAVAARILAENGYKITVLEKRGHIAGNIYDYYENGVLVHKYGPHLFHTRQSEISEFVQRFSDFFSYEHRVLGEIDSKLVPIPFNFKSIDLLYSRENAEKLKRILLASYSKEEHIPVMELRKHENAEIRKFAEFVFQKVFCGYTMKQWGIAPEDIDTAVMQRVPVRLSYDDRYFKDPFQKMPVRGFTYMVSRMLDHPCIALRLNCEAFDHIHLDCGKIYMDGEEWMGPVIYTGRIEALFRYGLGELPYRSLYFELERHNVDQYQPVVQVNYPNQYTYTRISEFKLVQSNAPKDYTYILYEYPVPCGKNDVPYYPVESKESKLMYRAYKQKAECFHNLFLLGRLAEFKYYNMDQAIGRAIQLSKRILDR